MLVLKVINVINMYDWVERSICVSESKELLVARYEKEIAGFCIEKDVMRRCKDLDRSRRSSPLVDRSENEKNDLRTECKNLGVNPEAISEYYVIECIECLKLHLEDRTMKYRIFAYNEIDNIWILKRKVGWWSSFGLLPYRFVGVGSKEKLRAWVKDHNGILEGD